jgi:hypothetical protein
MGWNARRRSLPSANRSLSWLIRCPPTRRSRILRRRTRPNRIGARCQSRRACPIMGLRRCHRRTSRSASRAARRRRSDEDGDAGVPDIRRRTRKGVDAHLRVRGILRQCRRDAAGHPRPGRASRARPDCRWIGLDGRRSGPRTVPDPLWEPPDDIRWDLDEGTVAILGDLTAELGGTAPAFVWSAPSSPSTSRAEGGLQAPTRLAGETRLRPQAQTRRPARGAGEPQRRPARAAGGVSARRRDPLIHRGLDL